MPAPEQLGIVDLVVLLVVAGAVISALRRRAGLLAALASGALAAIVCWLAAAAALAWGPTGVSSATDRSYLFEMVRPPVLALRQLTELLIPLISSTTTKGTPS